MSDIEKEIERLYKHFLNSHQTEATKKVEMVVKPPYDDISKMIDIYNVHITWSKTKEGYVYYYALNLRWVYALTMLCHEICPEKERFCLEKLNMYRHYCSSSQFNEKDRKQYNKTFTIFGEKIKKMREIFGK